MGKLIALRALTALTTVEHDGVKYGPGHAAGANFEATEAEAEPLLAVNAVVIADPDATPADAHSVAEVIAAGQHIDDQRRAVEKAQAKADADAADAHKAQAAADEQKAAAKRAQDDAETAAKAVADDRAKLDADIKAFAEAQAAAAKTTAKSK